MEYRKLGNSDLRLSVVGLGCWLIGNGEWTQMDDEKCNALIRKGLDLGVNRGDSSEVYGDGQSERVIARALEGCKRLK